MLQWAWAVLHGPAQQKQFLREVRSLLELSSAYLLNAQLTRERREDMARQNQDMIQRIDGILK